MIFEILNRVGSGKVSSEIPFPSEGFCSCDWEKSSFYFEWLCMDIQPTRLVALQTTTLPKIQRCEDSWVDSQHKNQMGNIVKKDPFGSTKCELQKECFGIISKRPSLFIHTACIAREKKENTITPTTKEKRTMSEQEAIRLLRETPYFMNASEDLLEALAGTSCSISFLFRVRYLYYSLLPFFFSRKHGCCFPSQNGPL